MFFLTEEKNMSNKAMSDLVLIRESTDVKTKCPNDIAIFPRLQSDSVM